MRADRLAVAAPVQDGIAAHLTSLEPRLDLRCAPDLLPPMRHPADFTGDPSFRRSPVDQRRFTTLLDDADALYGIPDVDPAALRRTVRANPRAKSLPRLRRQQDRHGWSGDLPTVLVSPHTAALGVHEDRRNAELFACNATRLLDGEELLNRVDLKEFY